MYHIKKDIRALKSAQLVGQGMMECLEQKGFKDITVSDIQRASGVSRSTFYRLFDNTSDVLAYLCDSVFELTHQRHSPHACENVDEIMLRFIGIWMENEVLLQAIVESQRIDLLRNSHLKYLAPCKDLLPSEGAADELQTSYLMTVLASCVAGFLEAWVNAGRKDTPRELQARIKACFKALGELFG